VGAWTVGGNVPDAKLQLAASAGAGGPTFSFGCGAGNGTSVCDLGAVDASSTQRQLQAEVTVPVTATTITSVSLTVTGTAASLTLAPAASAAVVVLASSGSAGAVLSPIPGTQIPASTTSPGGSAASLFPTVGPDSRSTPVANVSPLGGGTPLAATVAEVGGLVALAAAMLLAVTRLSFRRPAPRHAASSAAAPPPQEPSGPSGDPE
jgi:hypothetical protein